MDAQGHVLRWSWVPMILHRMRRIWLGKSRRGLCVKPAKENESLVFGGVDLVVRRREEGKFFKKKKKKKAGNIKK